MPRERKYAKSALDAVRDSLKNKNQKILAELTGVQDEGPASALKKIIKEGGSVFLVRGYDLRASLYEKAIDCHAHSAWTAFVNNAGTLIHLMPKEGDCHVRIPLFHAVKGCSDTYVMALVARKMGGRFV